MQQSVAIAVGIGANSFASPHSAPDEADHVVNCTAVKKSSASMGFARVGSGCVVRPSRDSLRTTFALNTMCVNFFGSEAEAKWVLLSSSSQPQQTRRRTTHISFRGYAAAEDPSAARFVLVSRVGGRYSTNRQLQ